MIKYLRWSPRANFVYINLHIQRLFTSIFNLKNYKLIYALYKCINVLRINEQKFHSYNDENKILNYLENNNIYYSKILTKLKKYNGYHIPRYIKPLTELNVLIKVSNMAMLSTNNVLIEIYKNLTLVKDLHIAVSLFRYDLRKNGIYDDKKHKKIFNDLLKIKSIKFDNVIEKIYRGVVC